MKRTSIEKEPKTTKTARFNVPAPQRERIVKKFIGGQGIRRISRDEHRTRETVSRIVNSTEVQGYVREIRAANYGMGTEALEAFRRALRKSTDGKIAYQLLADIGVVPDQDDRQRINLVPEATSDEEAKVQVIIGRLIQASIERAAVYRMPLSKMGIDLEAAGGRLNYATGAIEPIEAQHVSTQSSISKPSRLKTNQSCRDGKGG